MVRRMIVDLPAPEPEPEPEPEATAQPPTPTARVTGSQGVNVRSGPGTNFPILGVARYGDEGEIVGVSADGGWWAVSVPSAPNGIGWVSADLVVATNAENVPVIESPPPPTAAPTAVPATPIPTAVPPTPAPTLTATPAPQISFWADRTSLNQGECTTLRWSVENVQAVWVYPQGQDFNQYPRTGQGSETVCPATTTTYEMRVLLRDGTTILRQVTINVIPAPTATPVPPPPTATPVPPAPDPLANTRWDVVTINTGQAITSLLPGTSATVDFGAGGQISGNSGCNTYSGGYQTSANNLTISSLAGTSMMCAEPEGIMEQEAQLLTALQSAATFRINGNQLEIQNAAGQIAVQANRAP
jgi:heat shock protein HslJ